MISEANTEQPYAIVSRTRSDLISFFLLSPINFLPVVDPSLEEPALLPSCLLPLHHDGHYRP